MFVEALGIGTTEESSTDEVLFPLVWDPGQVHGDSANTSSFCLCYQTLIRSKLLVLHVQIANLWVWLGLGYGLAHA